MTENTTQPTQQPVPPEGTAPPTDNDSSPERWVESGP